MQPRKRLYHTISDPQQEENFSQIVHTSSIYQARFKKISKNHTSNKNVIYAAIVVIIIIGLASIYFNCQQGKQVKNMAKALEQKNNQIISLERQGLIRKQKKLQIINKIEQQLKSRQTNIQYKQGDSKKQLFNPIKTNSENKGVADVLYKDEQTKKDRLSFIEERIRFANSQKALMTSISMIQYNLIATKEAFIEGVKQNEKEWLRLQQKFKISSVKDQLPMCIISSSYNNNARFRIQANLNSVFFQNYTNFKQVIINDASTDGSGEIYRNYFSFHQVDKSKYVYIENTKRITALQNIYKAALQQCSQDSIIIVLDGDDELIGRNTLQLFNWAFQTLKAGVIYSNFYYYLQPQYVRVGFTTAYTEQERKNNFYRNIPSRISHLRAGRAQLFHQLNTKDLQDKDGKYFTIDADIALFIPLMELSCGRVNKIEGEFNLLYNSATGMNEYVINPQRELATQREIRAKPKSQCYKAFGDRMNS